MIYKLLTNKHEIITVCFILRRLCIRESDIIFYLIDEGEALFVEQPAC